MKKPDELLEIYLTSGEFYFGDRTTRIRTLIGEGGVVCLWSKKHEHAGVMHFRTIEKRKTSLSMDTTFADDALAVLMLEMRRYKAKPSDYTAKIFVYKDEIGPKVLEYICDLLLTFDIDVDVQHMCSGNLIFDFWSGKAWLQKSTPSIARAGKSPDEVMEVYLNPGEWYFGDEDTRIKTLLGSCVSFTLWHPVRRIGGMCHYMLPSRNSNANLPLDGKYADEAVELLVQRIDAEKTRPQDYIAKVFGGGSIIKTDTVSISEKNVMAARDLIKKHKFKLQGECLGGIGHRNVIFELWSGEVWLKKKEKPRR